MILCSVLCVCYVTSVVARLEIGVLVTGELHYIFLIFAVTVHFSSVDNPQACYVLFSVNQSLCHFVASVVCVGVGLFYRSE